MKKVLDIIYSAGSGGEFLTWTLGQQLPFVTQKAKIISSVNKWNLHGPSINCFNNQHLDRQGDTNWITDDKLINLHRKHFYKLEDLSETKNSWQDWNSAIIVLCSTTLESADWVNKIKSKKLDNAVPTEIYDKLKIDQLLNGCHYYHIEPNIFWNSTKQVRILFDWIETVFSVELQVDDFVAFANLWTKANLDILQERV